MILKGLKCTFKKIGTFYSKRDMIIFACINLQTGRLRKKLIMLTVFRGNRMTFWKVARRLFFWISNYLNVLTKTFKI